MTGPDECDHAPLLAVRLDSDGDVLLTGPAVRALAAGHPGPIDLLVSPSGLAAARLLPGVRDVLVFDAPWTGFAPPPAAGCRPATGVGWPSAGRCRT